MTGGGKRETDRRRRGRRRRISEEGKKSGCERVRAGEQEETARLTAKTAEEKVSCEPGGE
jgi:hypothetical protein